MSLQQPCPPTPNHHPPYLHDAGLFLCCCLCLSELLAQCIQVHTGGLQEQALNITTQQLEHTLQLNHLHVRALVGGGGGQL